MWIVDRCKEHHPRLPTCHGHRIEDIEDQTGVAIERPVFCHKHTDELISRNCQDCEQLLCMICRETDHESHKTETIDATLERVLPEIERYCGKIKELIADIDENKDELEARKTEVKAAKCRQDAEIQLQVIIDRATEDYHVLVKELYIREEEEVEKTRLCG